MGSEFAVVFDQQQFRAVQISEEEIDEVLELLERSLTAGSLSAGPLVREFERSFAAASGLPRAVGVAVASGTDALAAVLRAVGVSGRKVLVPTNTFAATAFAVIQAGADPLFVDMDERTLAPSPSQVREALGGHAGDIAALIVVHVGGFIGDSTAELAEICRCNDVALVEDAAHAHGSLYRGDPPGTWSSAAAYSFFATKVMTSAEGGMVVTTDEDIAAFVRSYRDQGRDPSDPLINRELGTNARLSELHAALGVVELRHLDSILASRRQVAKWYNGSLEDMTALTPFMPVEGSEPNYYKYLVTFDSAETTADFRAFARSKGLSLPSGVYDIPLHRQPAFASMHDGAPLPNAESFCSRHVGLPVSRSMHEEDVESVVSLLEEYTTQAALRP